MCRDHLIAAERKAHSTQNALEEARTLLEQADRARRIVEQELSDTNESLSELTCQNQAICGAKRKLDSELQTINVRYIINYFTSITEIKLCTTRIKKEFSFHTRSLIFIGRYG